MLDAAVVSVANLTALAILLATALLIEFRTRKIPNWLVLVALAIGLGLMLLDHLWTVHLLGLLLGLLVGATLFVIGVAGGGLAKFLTGVGSVIGPIATIGTTGIVLVVIGWVLVTSRSDVPDELRYDGEKRQRRLAKGSLIITIGTVIGLVFLIRPWG